MGARVLPQSASSARPFPPKEEREPEFGSPPLLEACSISAGAFCLFRDAHQPLGEGLIARPHCEEPLQVKGRGKPLLLQLTVVSLKFMPRRNFLVAGCEVRGVFSTELLPDG